MCGFFSSFVVWLLDTFPFWFAVAGGMEDEDESMEVEVADSDSDVNEEEDDEEGDWLGQCLSG